MRLSLSEYRVSQSQLTLGLGSKILDFITVAAHSQFISESHTDTLLQLTPTTIAVKRPKTLSVKLPKYTRMK